MTPPRAHKAFYVALLGVLVGCGDLAPESVDGTPAGIVGGWAANPGQIFATVEIRHVGAHSGFCSGVLISPSLVVTAAHCAVVEPELGLVEPSPPGSLAVAAGHLSSREASGAMLRSVVEAQIHDEYDHEFIMGRSRAGAGQGGIGSPNDIALLFLDRPFDAIPLAPVLTPGRQQELVAHGDMAFVAGYGVYDVEQGLGGELYISDAIIDIIGSRELLTRRSDQLGDSCFGDSGGPLYVPTKDGDFLVGLVSRGRSDVKRDCGDGGVYTLVSAHLAWIAETAGARFDPIIDSSLDTHSFVEEGAGPIVVAKGGSLRGTNSCAVSGSRNTHAPLWGFALLLAVASTSRRLSGRSL